MSTSVVIIRDHIQTLSTTLMYSRQQKAVVEKFWDRADPLLLSLQHQPVFAGRARLADLAPMHFRVLLALHLMLLAEVPPENRMDPANTTMRSLDWVLIGFLHLLERNTDGGVTTLTVNRVTEDNIIYDVALSLEPMTMPKPKKPTTGIRVVLDNEKA